MYSVYIYYINRDQDLARVNLETKKIVSYDKRFNCFMISPMINCLAYDCRSWHIENI